MARAVVRTPRSGALARDVIPQQRGPRELRHVRHPLHPDSHADRVLVVPSGVYVVRVGGGATRPSGAQVASSDLLAAEATARAVGSLLRPRYRSTVRPVHVVTGASGIAERSGEVLVTTEETLAHVLRAAPVVLSTSEVHAVARRLEAGLEPSPVAQPRRRRSWRGWWLAAAVALGGAVAAAVGAEVAPLPF